MQVIRRWPRPPASNRCAVAAGTTTTSPAAAGTLSPSTVNSASLDHEHLRVGMAVQVVATAGRVVDEEQRHAGAVLVALHAVSGRADPKLAGRDHVMAHEAPSWLVPVPAELWQIASEMPRTIRTFRSQNPYN